jgi:hypothetical protein
LDLLARDGHVKAIEKRIEKERGPIIQFIDVGRNDATTFTGFCSEHDAGIFKPIDTNAFRPEEPEHLFLAAYRAVSRELHAVTEGALKVQSAYLKRVELGLDSGDEPCPAGLVAVEHMARAHRTHLYKEQLDHALVSGRFDSVLHDVIRINHERATVAVCSFYSIDDLSRDGEPICAALNILPLNQGESVAVFTYLPGDAGPVKASLNSLLTSNGFYQKYLLSKLILNNCENFVLSPEYYAEWSAEKQKAVLDYFIKTIFTGHLDIESQHLYLF